MWAVWSQIDEMGLTDSMADTDRDLFGGISLFIPLGLFLLAAVATSPIAGGSDPITRAELRSAATSLLVLLAGSVVLLLAGVLAHTIDSDKPRSRARRVS